MRVQGVPAIPEEPLELPELELLEAPEVDPELDPLAFPELVLL